jgi:hypothetical protein
MPGDPTNRYDPGRLFPPKARRRDAIAEAWPNISERDGITTIILQPQLSYSLKEAINVKVINSRNQ